MSSDRFVVTNSSDRHFRGWVELTVPLPHAESLSAFWRYATDPTRLQPAFIGGPIGIEGRRAYCLMDEGTPPASGQDCELVTEPSAAPMTVLHERLHARPGPVPLPRLQQRGSQELAWSTDTTDSEGPLSWRRVIGRDGPFVVTVVAWRFADEPWTRFELSWIHSDPTNQALEAWHEDVFIGHEDAYVHVAGPTVDKLATKLEAGPFGWARRLWLAAMLGNGQGHTAVRGVLLHYLHARPGREDADLQSMDALQRGDIRAVAGTWEGHAGPFRAVPALSPYLQPDGGREAALARYQKWQEIAKEPVVPWAASTLGLLPNAGSTGGQDDFPPGPAPEVLSPSSVAPYNLAELEASGYGEARRPIHYREADGKRIKAQDHPDWWSWSQTTMYSPSRSPDRLGKPDWWGPYETHGFGGRDNQHCSINRLGAAVLLGGSRLLQEELDDQIVHWIKSLFDYTNRARGRHMHAAAWLHRLTGRVDLLAAMNRMADENAASWPSAGAAPAAWEIDCSSWGYPDGRVLGGRTPYWVGWSESLCAPGLIAGYRETGNEKLENLAVRSLTTLMLYGWFQRDGLPGWRLASGVTYRGFSWDPAQGLWLPNGDQGKPLPLEAYADKEQVEDSGGGFELWAYPAVKLASVLVPQHPVVAQRCQQIMDQIRSGRQPSKTFDDMDRWMAVA